MAHVTCRLTAKNRDQLRNPTLGNRVGLSATLPLYCNSKTCRTLLRRSLGLFKPLYTCRSTNQSWSSEILIEPARGAGVEQVVSRCCGCYVCESVLEQIGQVLAKTLWALKAWLKQPIVRQVQVRAAKSGLFLPEDVTSLVAFRRQLKGHLYRR